jgi:hypothetical protein
MGQHFSFPIFFSTVICLYKLTKKQNQNFISTQFFGVEFPYSLLLKFTLAYFTLTWTYLIVICIMHIINSKILCKTSLTIVPILTPHSPSFNSFLVTTGEKSLCSSSAFKNY